VKQAWKRELVGVYGPTIDIKCNKLCLQPASSRNRVPKLRYGGLVPKYFFTERKKYLIHLTYASKNKNNNFAACILLKILLLSPAQHARYLPAGSDMKRRAARGIRASHI